MLRMLPSLHLLFRRRHSISACVCFFTDRAEPAAAPKILQTRDLGEVEVIDDR
jgi:hypothetical protein